MSIVPVLIAMEPTFKIPVDDPIYLFRTETMYIACNPAGGPIPEKKWYVNDTLIENEKEGMERYHVYPNGTLRIVNVKKTDNGKYKCEATNEKGKAESAGTAFVLGE